MSSTYDVVIVGAGPAGIFAALELSSGGVGRILLIEKGHSLDRRRCPARDTPCLSCRTCDVMTGWGGAGAFSDGKLTLTSQVGGWLSDYLAEAQLDDLIRYADGIWLEFGATEEVHGPDSSTAASLVEAASSIGMRLTPMSIRHMGTDRSPKVLSAMRDELERRGVEIRTDTAAARLLSEDGHMTGVELVSGEALRSSVVVVAPGREGAEWLAHQAGLLGMKVENNAVDIGVRVECPASVMEPLTRPLYEAKLTYESPTFRDAVRTFCMNPYGEVTTESYGDVVTVNGHSYSEAKTGNTNFAVLVSQRFTEPFNDPITYGRSIARLANLLAGGILVQRYSDLKAGRRSTPERIGEAGLVPTMRHATPGDLSAVLPYRHMIDIIEFIDSLDRLVPGIADSSTLLYGVEVKFYSSRLPVDSNMHTEVTGLYAVGDGAGITRGLVQAASSGVLAARAILKGTQ